MSQAKQLSILEFSRLTGIRRENLRFYDRIGLLTPELRGENGYRYYTRHQLNSAYLIGSLRLLGVGLDDIREYSTCRTPEKMLELFARQEAHIQSEITRLRETSEIMELYSQMAQEALGHEEDSFSLTHRERERIFLCPPAPEGLSEDEVEIRAFEYAGSQGLNLGYPMGIMIPRESFHPQALSSGYQYYFRTGKKGNAWKPAGQYAVACGKMDLYHAEDLYRRLEAFIQEQGLETAGAVYGISLLDELAVQDNGQYCIQIEVPVTRPSM